MDLPARRTCRPESPPRGAAQTNAPPGARQNIETPAEQSEVELTALALFEHIGVAAERAIAIDLDRDLASQCGGEVQHGSKCRIMYQPELDRLRRGPSGRLCFYCEDTAERKWNYE
jgi:hypothetical protein